MARAATTADAFNAVGDATRRQILDVLAGGESTVGELVDRLGITQPLVSQHLKVLRDVHLVQSRVEGRHHFYKVDRAGLAPLEQWLTRLTREVNAHYDRLDNYLDAWQRPSKRRK